MNKFHLKWWLIATAFFLSFPVFSQQYSIHLAAFTEQIDPSFFSFAGFSDVQHQQKSFNLHQYYWGEFASLAAAKNQLTTLQQNSLLKGLTNLSVLLLSTNFTAPSTNSNVDNKIESVDFQLFSRSIYVHSASKGIQKMDVAVLEEVALILKKDPTLKLRITALENSNAQLTPPVTDVVENYLLAQNIPAYRIKTIPTPLDSHSERKGVLSHKKQQVIMTLVDLKEEIILDKFGNTGLMVKQMNNSNNLQVLD